MPQIDWKWIEETIYHVFWMVLLIVIFARIIRYFWSDD